MTTNILPDPPATIPPVGEEALSVRYLARGVDGAYYDTDESNIHGAWFVVCFFSNKRSGDWFVWEYQPHRTKALATTAMKKGLYRV